MKLTVKRIRDALSAERERTRRKAKSEYRTGVLLDRARDMRTETMMDKGCEPWFITSINRKEIERLAEEYDYEPISIEGGFDWAESLRNRADFYEPTDFFYYIEIIPKKGKSFTEWELDA